MIKKIEILREVLYLPIQIYKSVFIYFIGCYDKSMLLLQESNYKFILIK